MKHRSAGLYFLFILLVSLTWMQACTEKFPDPTEHKRYSDTKPFLKDGAFPLYTNSEDILYEEVYNEKFGGVKLHQPEALAVVKRNNTSKKTLQDQLPGDYHLYELVDTGFQMVLGSEGNIFTLSHLASVNKINDTWQIFTGTRNSQGKITMTSADITIVQHAELKVDTIYDADTVSVADDALDPIWIHSTRSFQRNSTPCC